MPSMQMIFTQILTIFLYVAVGFAAGKLRIVNPDQRKYLTRICSDLVQPFTILSASSLVISATEMTHLGIATVVMFGMFASTSLCMLIATRRKSAAERALYTSLATYPNATYLGLPLCTALFGSIAILYNAAVTIAFNVLFFTLQYSLFTGRRFSVKNLLTSANGATLLMLLMLATGLRFPSPVETVVKNIGSMITPLSLIIIGVMISERRILEVLREKRAYGMVLLRNFILPLIAMAVLSIVPIDQTARMCVLVYLSGPCAALSVIYAIRCDVEPELCAKTVLLSTLSFAVSLPCMLLLAQWVL